MALIDDLRKSGAWLFRFRSFLPLLLGFMFLLAINDYQYALGNRQPSVYWEIFCLSVSFLGLGIRFVTIGYVPHGTSGRNTKKQRANVLNTTGPYSLVRHPLYLGNFFIWLGISLIPRVWWLTVIIALIFWLYYERIMLAEEDFLQQKFGDSFAAWADKTPAFLPRFRGWINPDAPFSWKTAIKRENYAFFAIIAAFTALEFLGASLVHGKLMFNLTWIAIFFISLGIFLFIRYLKKHTACLEVEGR
jgi:protein-S-isoprenylcysteine O-methyltransferase Ste14